MGVQVSHWMAYRLYRKADDSDWWGHKESLDRAIILSLVKMNQQVEKGLISEEERIKFANLLEPWQVHAANTYFD